MDSYKSSWLFSWVRASLVCASDGCSASTPETSHGHGGAAGEQWTADELARLNSEWRSHHDIPDGKGNWDHVAVGPPGVFTIDSKSLRDSASVDDEGLRAGRLHFGGNKAVSAAVRMKELIEQETGHALWVQAVFAVWGKLLPEPMLERNHVLYVEAPRLVETLESLRPRLTAAQRSDVNEALENVRRSRA